MKKTFLAEITTGNVTHVLLQAEGRKKQWAGRFGMIFLDQLWRIREMELSGTEYDVLMLLFERSKKESGEVDCRPTEIGRALGIARETANRAKSRFLRNGILLKDGNKKFFLSAWFFWKGKTENLGEVRRQQNRYRLVEKTVCKDEKHD